MIDNRFLAHNSHLENPSQFEQLDPQLRVLKHQKYVYHAPLLNEIPDDIPGIYTLGGGRQIGKSTLLKQWMLELLKKGKNSNSIYFITGEIIDDQHALLLILTDFYNNIQKSTTFKKSKSDRYHYIIIDEITYIKDWDKAIKFAADSGLLESTILILSGSDLSLMQEAKLRFPGRRGQADIVNFHLYPLSFKETVILKHPKLQSPLENHIEILFELFQEYLLHGGYLRAINDLALYQSINNATLNTYSEWIRGDMIKRGKQEHYLKEILNAIIKRYNSQVSWNALAQDLSIDHPKTVADYCAQLESMDALFIQEALLEEKLTAAPKKRKKLMFCDPFIFHALRYWLKSEKNPYETQILTALVDPEFCSKLVEACVTTHYRRHYPTYYIKAEGEVDIAYVHKQRFWPIEVKWTNQLRPKDLKQILKYRNGRILAKTDRKTSLESIPVEPLALALMDL